MAYFISIDSYETEEGVSDISLPAGSTRVGRKSFFNHDEIESVTMPDTVVSIDEAAFAGCTNLREVQLSNRVKFIGSRAFEHCVSLNAVTLPDEVAELTSCVFRGCRSLERLDVSQHLLSIMEQAFAGCSALHSIKPLDDLAFIGRRAFSACASLEHIELPDTLIHLESEAFIGCTKLCSIRLPDRIGYMGNDVFAGCKSLDFGSIPEHLKRTFPDAFPQEVMASFGYVKKSSRPKLLKAYKKRHAREIAELEKELDNLSKLEYEAECELENIGWFKWGAITECRRKLKLVQQQKHSCRTRLNELRSPTDSNLITREEKKERES